MNTLQLGNKIFSVLAAATMLFPGVSGIAQGNATNPGSPAINTNLSVATTPSTSTDFGLKVTACRYTFDWDTYLADQAAGRTNSNPYIDQGCVTTEDMSLEDGVKYADFEVGTAATKAAFGNDPVLGIMPNAGFNAQSLDTYNFDGSADVTKDQADRSEAENLDTIFTAAQLNEIYSTGGDRTAIPRIFSTGPDEYRTLSNGNQVYRGGRCKVENGLISVRTERVGEAYNPTLQGINPDTPFESCARLVDGERQDSVEDQNLKVYQFLYEFTYPTAEQCETYFNVDGATCLVFFRNRYGRDLAGNGETGNRTISTYTYYGSFDDAYSKWVGWVNPDVDGPRQDSTDGFIRAYDGYSVYALD